MKRAYLALADGQVFEGYSFGAEPQALGELVFTTGMGGYTETLTDPSYCGQIVLQTFPLIGNYGIMEEDFEGKTHIRGYVVREYCSHPSNFRCEYDLDTYLKRNGIPGIFGVDTRQITRIIRENGVINAAICGQIPKDFSAIAAYRVENAVAETSSAAPCVYPEQGRRRAHVVMLDYGAKRNIVRCLTARGCKVTVLPHNTPAQDVLALAPDGVMLSNGPGDPAENVYEIAQIQKLLGRVPVFGICLGHQLLALAAGGHTVKLKYGHRGANQPVRELATGRTYITSQNHGYAVVAEGITAGRVSYVNANDGTCEGMDYPELNAFSVQFHPEAHPGPCDCAFLFDRFIARMGG